ncbi:hypothetical protein OG417_03300 [Actinoallomurus sp. NBC_01490]|uniref:hypothetical protein n=1 Tax=Actinoallomurus sp. NBC_01490 TaxID=2903557 RepID=UPI002E33807E|nr:hypothetical protein [Actinoallomurus sp. NBC_01490]
MTNSGTCGAASPEQYADAMAILGQTPEGTDGPRPGGPPAGRDEGGRGDGAGTRRT